MGRIILTLMLGVGLLAGCPGQEEPRARCESQVIASELQVPYGILPDGNGYLLTVSGAVVRLDASGTVSTLATLAEGSSSGMAREGQAVVVIENATGSLIRFGPEWQGETQATGLGDVVSLAQDGNGFVVTDYDNWQGPGQDRGRLLRVLPGGEVVLVAAQGLGGPTGVVVRDGVYFVADFDGGRLLRVTRDGSIAEVAEGLGNPVDIKEYGGNFYVSDFAGGSSGGRILEVTAAGEVRPLDIAGIGSPSGLAIAGAEVLITDSAGGKLLRLSGCLPQ